MRGGPAHRGGPDGDRPDARPASGAGPGQWIPPLERHLRRGAWDALRLLGVVVLVPNAVFWTVGGFWALPRPTVNLDYALLALLFPWLGATGTAAGTACFALIDMLVAGAYHFRGNPGALLQAAPDALLLPASTLGPAVGLLLGGAVALGWAVRRLLRSQPRSLGPNLGAAGGGFLIALVLNPLAPPLYPHGRAVVLGDLLDHTIIPAVAMGTEFRGFTEQPIPSATAPLFEALDNGEPLPRRIVLAVMESWGVFHDPKLNAFALAGLDTAHLADGYTVERGRLPAFGSTVNGEMRELCAGRTVSVRPDTALVPVETCLPNRLRDRGYRTIGLHGFRRDFFNRQEWWPALGLDRVMFQEEMTAALSPSRRCGSMLVGLCDTDAVRLIGTLLDARSPEASGSEFVYWLSLNAHSPYRRPPDAGEATHPCEAPGSEMPREICYYSLWNQRALGALSDLAAREAGRDVAWIIVGDHPPIFPTDDLKRRVLQDSVPWIRLWPRPADR